MGFVSMIDSCLKIIEKGKLSNVPTIPKGSKSSVHTGQLLISSGLYDLDSIIGGGFSVGSLICLKEDSYSQYNQTLLDYFICEGISNEQNTIIIQSSDYDLKELPFNYSKYKQDNLKQQQEEEEKNKVNISDNLKEKENELKIAWRYNEFVNQKIEEKKLKEKKLNEGTLNKKSGTVGCHEYDLSKNIQNELLNQSNIKIINNELTNDINGFNLILKKIYLNLNENKNNITRICIRSLGILNQNENDILKFLYSLKTIIRNKMCICFFSIPKIIFNFDFLNHINHLSDLVFDMDSFKGKGVDPIEFKDFTGILNLQKLSKINSLTFNYSPDTLNYVFTRKKRKIYIERMYLPPEVSRATNQSDRPKFDSSKIKPKDIDF
eukprot:gene6054-10055_t